MCVVCTLDMTCFSIYSHNACVCMHKINEIEALVQSSHVCTRRVHDKLHEHMCMSVMYTPNLVCMHVDVYMNCKPRMMA